MLESVEVEPSGLHPGQPKDECTHMNLIGIDSIDYSRISINVYIYIYICIFQLCIFFFACICPSIHTWLHVYVFF